MLSCVQTPVMLNKRPRIKVLHKDISRHHDPMLKWKGRHVD